MRDTRMNPYGVKSKSHLAYLTTENCFFVENFGIYLLSSFGDYLRKCTELFLVLISTCLTRFCPFDWNATKTNDFHSFIEFVGF